MVDNVNWAMLHWLVLSLMEGYQFEECYLWSITQTKCQKQRLKCVDFF